MTLIQALVLAAVQGVTELFPVSSLGHAVILPHLLGWGTSAAQPVVAAKAKAMRREVDISETGAKSLHTRASTPF